VDDLIRALDQSRPERVYLIVDQHNALDYQGGAGDTTKSTVRGYIGAMMSGQSYIFSASPNEQAERDADKKQTGIKTIYLRKGMTEVRLRLLKVPRLTYNRRRRRPGSNTTLLSYLTLSPVDQDFVKYITGCIPLGSKATSSTVLNFYFAMKSFWSRTISIHFMPASSMTIQTTTEGESFSSKITLL
jgi:hypothetical protein